MALEELDLYKLEYPYGKDEDLSAISLHELSQRHKEIDQVRIAFENLDKHITHERERYEQAMEIINARVARIEQIINS